MWYVEKCDVVYSELFKQDIKGTTIGRCRRHAPTMNGYPVVHPTDWCGDHKLDETKI
jgi:hypothetical protein